MVRLLLLSGADQSLVNNDGRTALCVASCPNNPCTNPDLGSVVKLLSGDLPLGEAPDTTGASKGLFKERILSVKIKAPAKPASMSGEEAVAKEAATKEEDVYEFKTSKESTPTSSRASASPGNGGETAGTSAGPGGEKRAKEEDAAEEEGEGRQKKKRKEDTAAGAGRGRGIRGNSSEKTVGGKAVGRGRGAANATNNPDRKSPSGSSREAPSPAPSPGKGKGGCKESGQGESDSDGERKGEVGPKVPPLKIVLNSGTSSREEDKKKNYIVNNGSEDGESSEGKTEGTESSTGEGEKAGRGERMTRSRGQQEEDGQEAGVKEEMRQGLDNEYQEWKNIKKRKLRGGTAEDPNNSNAGFVRPSGEPLTDIEKHLNIRKQIEQRRKNLFPVQPKPPQGFKDYLMNKKTYHLEGNTGKDKRIQPIPKIAPPPSLEGALRDLFLSQENERYKLRMKHLVEKEKLVLAVEQEILRVHGRAARALANQSLPYSVCTILRDEEVSSSFSIIVHIKMYIPRFTLPLTLTKRRRIEIFVADTMVDFSSLGCKM